MLNKWTRGFLAAVLGLGLVGTSLAEERGTKDEAVAMTSAAVEHVPDGHPKLPHLWPVKLLQAGQGGL